MLGSEPPVFKIKVPSRYTSTTPTGEPCVLGTAPSGAGAAPAGVAAHHPLSKLVNVAANIAQTTGLRAVLR
ncbi:MAG: hypothetical protein QOG65_1769 [Actinomycetota bacterium]|nr:hypothetical protein [Actinomycetota bacterium]